jgi:integrase/recombinase XerD
MTALSDHAADYLQLRRALGHKLADAHRLLPRFVACLDAAGATTVTVEAALVWARCPDADPASSVWMRRMAVARGFARHMAGIDPATEVPPPGLVTFRQRRRCPFIYSEADITVLMAQARRAIPTPLRAATVETLIGLLAATGMRVGEAIRLEQPDAVRPDGVIVVRDSKFGKSRLVPLHASAVAALAAYARRRDRLGPRPQSPTFFVSTAGTALLYSDLCHTFRKLVDETGVGAPRRPTIHDLRHTFAVKTLAGWYRDGHDVQARLPRLATFLGHRNPASTYWYLSAAPELLSLAAARLEMTQETRS